MGVIAKTIDAVCRTNHLIGQDHYVDELLNQVLPGLGFDRYSIADLETQIHNPVLQHQIWFESADGKSLLTATIRTQFSAHTVICLEADHEMICHRDFGNCIRLIANSLSDHLDLLKSEDIDYNHQSQMITLGEFTASIMHEVANPTTVIRGVAMRLEKRLHQGKSDPQLIETSLDSIQQSVSRIADIIKTVKHLSYAGFKTEFVESPVKNIIESSVKLLSWSIRGTDIDLQIEPFDESLHLQCVPGRLNQVLVNLMTNARDALKESRKPGEKYDRLDVQSTGSFLIIGVEDNGPGIPAALHHRVFERFFTTKAAGKGTGIGLWMCQNIVQEHGGTLSCSTSPEGTQFVLTLPKQQARDQEEAA